MRKYKILMVPGDYGACVYANNKDFPSIPSDHIGIRLSSIPPISSINAITYYIIGDPTYLACYETAISGSHLAAYVRKIVYKQFFEGKLFLKEDNGKWKLFIAMSGL